MIAMWPIYTQVVLSCFFHSGYGCLDTESLPVPSGYKVMLMSDVRKNYKPNTFVLMTYSDALAQGKLQGARSATKSKRELPAQTGRGGGPTAADGLRTAGVPPSAPRDGPGDVASDGRGRGRHAVVDGDRRDDVWREDVTVTAVVVDPGRRVRVFARTDGDGDDDYDGNVAAVDARVVDPTADDPNAAAAEDDVLAVAALYFPVVDKLARQIVPGIRWKQVFTLAVNAARATWDAVERLAAAARDGKATRTPVASTRHVLSKPVNYDYASSRIYDTWENIFRNNYQYIPSFSNPIHSNSFEQQTVYEGENDHKNLYDKNSANEDEYVEDDNDDIDDNENTDDDDFDDDDVDHNDDSDDDIDVDDDDDIDYNDDISYEVDNSDHLEVYVNNMSNDNGNFEASELDKIVQSKKILDEIHNIKPSFIEDMSGKQLVQYVNGLNIKHQGPIAESQKLCIKLMKFDENVSEKDIQQLITTITNASNLFIASALDQYKVNS